MESCAEMSDKFNLVEGQSDFWWADFFANPDADEIIAENAEFNKGTMVWQVVTMKFNWETGYYFDAGKRFGNFWKVLLGEPEWTVEAYADWEDDEDYEISDEQVAKKKHNAGDALVDFEAAALATLQGKEIWDDIQGCVIRDELAFWTYDTLMKQFYPEYNEFGFKKYFDAVQVYDRYNWAKCGGVSDDLDSAMGNNGKWWIEFWTQEGAEDLSKANAAANEKEIAETVGAMLKAWYGKDYAIAGAKWAHFWTLIIGAPEGYGKKPTEDDLFDF